MALHTWHKGGIVLHGKAAVPAGLTGMLQGGDRALCPPDGHGQHLMGKGTLVCFIPKGWELGSCHSHMKALMLVCIS